MNILRRLGLSVFALSLLFCTFLNVKADQGYKTVSVYVIAQNGLNIRSTPGTEKEKIALVKKGTRLTLIENYDTGKDNWSAIYYKGEIRFICNKYVTKELKDTASGEVRSGEQQKKQQNKTYLGSYRITFYCNCSRCCGQWAGGPTASGVYPEAGVTIATGSEFSYGTKLMINGHTYTVQDRGVGNGCIDIYCSSHAEACAGGMYYTDVYLIN